MTKHRHFIVHKPDGYLSQFITNGDKKKRHKFLGELHDFPIGTMSIGRLDLLSEGLLLLTTDGKVSASITSKKFEKEYYCQIDGNITDEAITNLQNGVDISIDTVIYQTLPSKVKRIEKPDFPMRNKKIRDDRHGPTSWISVTIREGKFHQVRKMTSVVGFPTLRLVRVRIGDIKMKKYQPGFVQEVDQLI